MPRKLLVRNDSKVAIDGDLEIWAGPWSQPKREKLAAVNNASLKAGGVAAIPSRTGRWKPNAYVVSARASARRPSPARRPGDDRSIDLDWRRRVQRPFEIASGDPFRPRAKGGARPHLRRGQRHARLWLAGLHGQLVWRLAAGAVCRGQGPRLRLRAAGRARPTTGRTCSPRRACPSSHGKPAAGVRHPPSAPFEVPGEKEGIDLWNPRGMALMKGNAAEVGKANAENPLIVSYRMDNEACFPSSTVCAPPPRPTPISASGAKSGTATSAPLTAAGALRTRAGMKWSSRPRPAMSRESSRRGRGPKGPRPSTGRLRFRHAHPGDPQADCRPWPRHGLGTLANRVVAVAL